MTANRTGDLPADDLPDSDGRATGERAAGEPAAADVAEQQAAEELVRHVVRPVVRDVDPEDWSRSGGSDDDRYLRERPPHWG